MSVLLVILGLVAGVAFMVLKALAVDQAKGHIQRYLRASLEATIDALPAEVQARWAEEWRADLAMHSSMPVTALRFVRGVRRSARKLIGDPALAPVSFRQRTRSRVIPTGVTPVVRSGACESSMRPRRWASKDGHDEAHEAHSRAGHPQAARCRSDAGRAEVDR